MPKNPKEKKGWAEDQRERGYYYDDAHGYEDYDPERAEEEEEEEERKKGSGETES